jgi:hypothetical protein
MLKKIILPAFLVTFSFVLISWGVIGHRAIGKIAENHLSSKAKKAVQDILGSESLAMVKHLP